MFFYTFKITEYPISHLRVKKYVLAPLLDIRVTSKGFGNDYEPDWDAWINGTAR